MSRDFSLPGRSAIRARNGVLATSHPLGGGQAILRDAETGFWVAGSDPRKDGQAAGY